MSHDVRTVVPPAHARWLDAETEAQRAEAALHREWVAFFFRGGPAPSSDGQRRVAMLRSLAHLALNEAREERHALKSEDLQPA